MRWVACLRCRRPLQAMTTHHRRFNKDREVLGMYSALPYMSCLREHFCAAAAAAAATIFSLLIQC